MQKIEVWLDLMIAFVLCLEYHEYSHAVISTECFERCSLKRGQVLLSLIRRSLRPLLVMQNVSSFECTANPFVLLRLMVCQAMGF